MATSELPLSFRFGHACRDDVDADGADLVEAAVATHPEDLVSSFAQHAHEREQRQDVAQAGRRRRQDLHAGSIGEG